MFRVPVTMLALALLAATLQPAFAQEDDGPARPRPPLIPRANIAPKAAQEAHAENEDAEQPEDAPADKDAEGKDNAEKDSLEQMLDTIEEVTKLAIHPDAPPQEAEEQRMLQQEFPRVKSYLQRNDYMNARRQVRSWSRRASSKSLQQLCRSIALELEKEVDAQIAPLIDRADDLIAESQEILLNAKDPEELDDLAERFYEFSSFEFRINTQSRIVQRARERIQAGQRYVDQYQQFLMAEESGNDSQAYQILSQLTQGRSYGYNVDLIPQSKLIGKRQEMERRIMDEAQEKMNGFNDKIDIDTTLDEVYAIQGELDVIYNTMSFGNLYSARGRMDRVRSTLQSWLSVLYAEEAEDYNAALQQLQSMQSMSYRDHHIISGEIIAAKRKSLVEKIGGGSGTVDEQVRAVLNTVEDDVTAIEAQDKLDELREVSGSETAQELFAVRSDLAAIAFRYRALNNDRRHQVWESSGMGAASGSIHRWMDVIDGIREKQLRAAIAASLDMPTFEPAGDDETPAAGVLRMADEAVAANDWQRVYTVLDLYKRAFAGNSPPAWLLAELGGCEAYLAGRQLEKFGQTDKARDAYLDTLKQLGQRVPHADAAKRLEGLKEQG